VNVVFLTAIVFPILFALIELLADVLRDPPRQGERKFKVLIFEGNGEVAKAPLDLSALRKEFKGKKDIRDIEVMPPRIRETNIGVDLCLGAIAANLAILLNMLLSTSIAYTPILRVLAVVSLGVELAVLLVMITTSQAWGNAENPKTRVIIAQSSNLVGVVLLILQFGIFGKVLTA
jgi:hypothetical protein